jgi:hypothetical protein
MEEISRIRAEPSREDDRIVSPVVWSLILFQRAAFADDSSDIQERYWGSDLPNRTGRCRNFGCNVSRSELRLASMAVGYSPLG